MESETCRKCQKNQERCDQSNAIHRTLPDRAARGPPTRTSSAEQQFWRVAQRQSRRERRQPGWEWAGVGQSLSGALPGRS